VTLPGKADTGIVTSPVGLPSVNFRVYDVRGPHPLEYAVSLLSNPKKIVFLAESAAGEGDPVVEYASRGTSHKPSLGKCVGNKDTDSGLLSGYPSTDRDLIGLNVELLRQLGQRLFALQSSQCHFRLECRAVVVSSSTLSCPQPSWPLSRRNSTYRPVQIRPASSHQTIEAVLTDT
jgi:hypothetical protein